MCTYNIYVGYHFVVWPRGRGALSDRSSDAFARAERAKGRKSLRVPFPLFFPSSFNLRWSERDAVREHLSGSTAVLLFETLPSWLINSLDNTTLRGGTTRTECSIGITKDRYWFNGLAPRRLVAPTSSAPGTENDSRDSSSICFFPTSYRTSY